MTVRLNFSTMQTSLQISSQGNRSIATNNLNKTARSALRCLSPARPLHAERRGALVCRAKRVSRSAQHGKREEIHEEHVHVDASSAETGADEGMDTDVAVIRGADEAASTRWEFGAGTKRFLLWAGACAWKR